MTHQGRGPGERVGFFTSLANYFAPTPIPENDSGPISAPKGVRFATYFVGLAGVIFTAWYVWGISRLSEMEQHAREVFREEEADCVARFGGIGDAAVSPGEETDDFIWCRDTPALTDESFHDVRIFFTVIALIFIAMGVALLAAAPFLRAGRMWARRVVVTALILTLVAAMAAGMSDVITLAGALALIAATTLCYVSSGATFFLRVQAQPREPR